MHTSCSSIFNKHLKRITFWTWLLRLLPIPIGIIAAKLMADLVSNAIDGNINRTVTIALIIFIGAIVIKIFNIVSEIPYEKAKTQALHKCKMDLYHQFLSNPLHRLYRSEHGVAIEKLNDDFDTITGKNLSLYPEVGTGIITLAVYSIFLGIQNPWIAVILIAISLIQLIPPVIVKKYMQVNYDSTREIEAKLTDFVIGGYRGFAEIKLYHLKQWWIDKLKEYHKEYSKIGNVGIYTNSAHHAMNVFIDQLLRYGTYGIIGLFVLLEYSSMDVGIQAIALSGGLFAAVKSIFSLIPEFGVVKTAEKRMAEWFDAEKKQEKVIGNAQIELSDVSFFYNEKRMYQHINVVFDCEKINVVQGANGIGKSTLFRMITGLLCCNEGKIMVGGIPAVSLSDRNYPDKLFYLPQEDVEFDFSAEELYRMTAPEKVEAAIQIAKRFQLADDLIRKNSIRDLSGGERKKVFLSLAFAVSPLILLLDEPTNSLDEEGKTVLKQLLQERKGGALIITHETLFDNLAGCCYQITEGGAIIEKA